MNDTRQNSLAFYLGGLIVGIASASVALVFNLPVWTVPLMMFFTSATGFATIDAVRRRSAARAYTFRGSGTYTLMRERPPGR